MITIKGNAFNNTMNTLLLVAQSMTMARMRIFGLLPMTIDDCFGHELIHIDCLHCIVILRLVSRVGIDWCCRIHHNMKPDRISQKRSNGRQLG